MIEIINLQWSIKLFKIQDPRLLHPSHSNADINIVIPYFPKFSFSVSKILKRDNFKIILSQIKEISCENVGVPLIFNEIVK